MPIENFGGFNKFAPTEKITRPGEKLSGLKKTLWERSKILLERFGLDLNGRENLEIENRAVAKIKEIRNNNENDKFLDLEFSREDNLLNLRVVGKIDAKHNPGREKDYNKWDLTPQEEAERWLNREILVNEKLGKFTAGETVSADELVEANRNNEEVMYLLKRTKDQSKSQEQYGEAEGRALAKALLGMQTNLDATGMIKEIMAENGIKTKLEMEQKIFEDYFDHFNGYMDNSRVILEDLGDDNLAESINNRMEQYRMIIENCQLKENEYSFVHGDINFATVKYAEDGKAYLSDWQRAGKTQNKELSLVYDLGNAIQEAIEKFEDISQVEAYIGGIEKEVRSHYQDQPDVADAVINLTKLRSLAMLLNDQEGEKREFILKQFGE